MDLGRGLVFDVLRAPLRVAAMASLALLMAPAVDSPMDRAEAPVRSPVPERIMADSAASCAAAGCGNAIPAPAKILINITAKSHHPTDNGEMHNHGMNGLFHRLKNPASKIKKAVTAKPA